MDQTALMQWLMQMLSQPQTGDLKDDKSVLDFQAKGVNNIQDFLQLMLSPQFAMMSGTYDPMLAAPAAPEMPKPFVPSYALTQTYANSSNPTMSLIANGMMGGQMDALTAKQYIADAVAKGELVGVTPEIANDVVDKIEAEIVQNTQGAAQYEADMMYAEQQAANAPRTDEWAKYGLPSPLEQYTADTIPTEFGQQRQAAQANVESLTAAKEQAIRNAGRSDTFARVDAAGERGGGSGRTVTADRMERERPVQAAPAKKAPPVPVAVDRGAVMRGEASEGAAPQGIVDRGAVMGGAGNGDGPQGIVDRSTVTASGKADGDSMWDLAMKTLSDSMVRGAKRIELLEAKKPAPKKEKPKKDQGVINAGSRLALAQSDSAYLEGRAGGAAALARKQGRSPLVDAMMQRFMATQPTGL